MTRCDTCGYTEREKPVRATCPRCQTGRMVAAYAAEPDPVADTLAALVIEGFIDPDDVPNPLSAVVGDDTAQTVATLVEGGDDGRL